VTLITMGFIIHGRQIFSEFELTTHSYGCRLKREIYNLGRVINLDDALVLHKNKFTCEYNLSRFPYIHFTGSI